MKRFLKRRNKKPRAPVPVEKQISRRTAISFGLFILANGAAVLGWRWLRKQPSDGGLLGGIQQPLRDGLKTNEKIFQSAFDPNKLAKEFPKNEAVKKSRVNGWLGLNNEEHTDNWKLNVQKQDGANLEISLEDIKKLPKTEVIYNFKCIEGWSQIMWWGGVRLSDFMDHYGLTKEKQQQYIGLSTPDEEYYVGIDMPSALHPQTILCYEHNGQPLSKDHGYPLRLIIPVKYGIKSLKRIGLLFFDNEPPSDYWAERGYDYYSGL